MDAHEAEELATELIAHHLSGYVVHFRFDRSLSHIGCVSHTEGEDFFLLALSLPLVKLNPPCIVRDTILHEIAHILVGLEHDHDEVWQAKALELGANPVKTEPIVVPPHPYLLVCLGCDQVLQWRRRKISSGRLSELICSDCGSRNIRQIFS